MAEKRRRDLGAMRQKIDLGVLSSRKSFSALLVSHQLVERDRRRIREVERRLRRAGRQPRQEIATLSGEAAHATALRAEHDRDTVSGVELAQRLRCRFI